MLLLMVADGGVRARTILAEASVGGGLVDGCSFWWWDRRAELIQVLRCQTVLLWSYIAVDLLDRG